MKSIDLTEIFKDWREEEVKLYSPAFGEVILTNVKGINPKALVYDKNFPITVKTTSGTFWTFTSDGRIYPNGEVMLFPSKENKDWSTYVFEPKAIKYNLKPYDKVLGRDDPEFDWLIDIFVDYQPQLEYPYNCFRSAYKYCIPYEGNENLIQ